MVTSFRISGLRALPIDLNFSALSAQVGKVAKQMAGQQAAGPRRVQWDASQVPAGLYVYTLKTRDQLITKKLVEQH